MLHDERIEPAHLGCPQLPWCGTVVRLRMGQPARREDLVRIFDAGPDIVPVFVQAQTDQFDEWRESLRA